MTVPAKFRAFRIHDDGGYRSGIETISLDDLNPGEVVVKAAYSTVNFKDALAGTGQGKILRRFPLVGGIDVAGHVVASTDPAFREGDAVLVTGSGLSETRDGGYAEYARLESKWVIALPAGLSLRESMILGTAGFTAALALLRMQDNRQTPDHGPAGRHRCHRRRRLAGDRHLREGRLRGARDQRQGRPGRVPEVARRQRGARPRRACPPPARWKPRASAAAWTTSAARCWPPCSRRPRPTATSPAAGLAASPRAARHGDALHHPRRVPARGGLGRHRARPARRGLAAPVRRTGSPPIWTRSAPAKPAWTGSRRCSTTMLAGGSFGRTVVRLAESD